MPKWLEPFLHKEQHQLFLWAPVLLGLGICLYFAPIVEPPSFYAYVALILVTLGVFIPSQAPLALGYGARAMAFVAAGYALISIMAVYKPAFPTVPLKGRLRARVQQVDYFENKIRLLFEPGSLRGKAIGPARVNFRYKASAPPPRILPGDYVSVWVNVTPPPQAISPKTYDFQKRAFFAGIQYTGYGSLRSLKVRHYKHKHTLNTLRSQLAHNIEALLPPPQASVVKALTVGDKSGITPTVREYFAISGLAHILAISGLHMSIIASVIFLLLNRLLALLLWRWPLAPTRKIAAVVTILFTGFYLCISGGGIPAQRAFVMTTLIMLAIMAERSAINLRTLALAALFILGLYPQELLFPSFQMSFAAVLALVSVWEFLNKSPRFGAVFYRRGSLLYKVMIYVVGSALTSLIASVATAPFSVLHFKQFSLVGVVANMLAIPLATVVIMPLCFLLVVTLLIGGAFPAVLLAAPINWLINIASFFANLGIGHYTTGAQPAGWISLIVVGGLCMLLWRSRLRWVGAPIVACAFLLPRPPLPLLVVAGTNKNIMRIQDNQAYVLRQNTYATKQWQEIYTPRQVAKLPSEATGVYKVGTADMAIRYLKTAALAAPPAPGLTLSHTVPADIGPSFFDVCGGFELFASGERGISFLTNAHYYGQRLWNGYDLRKCNAKIEVLQKHHKLGREGEDF